MLTLIWNITYSRHLGFFYANKEILCAKNVSPQKRLRFFRAIITPIACFGACSRTLLLSDLAKLDAHFRTLVRSVVGPPVGVDWSDAWHNVLHAWNQRVSELVDQCSIPTWATFCLHQNWKFAAYIARLHSARWVKRLVLWKPEGRRCLDDPYRLGIPNLKLFVDTMIYLAGSMLRKSYNSGIAWPVTLWSSICDETNCFSAIFLLECFLTGLCFKRARHPAIRDEMK